MSYQGDGLDLLPPNATPQEREMSLTISRISDIQERPENSPVLSNAGAALAIRDVWNIANCPSALLPWLAWSLSVSQWSSSWTDTQKRAVLSAAVAVHQIKGTIGAVQSVIAAFGLGMAIQEWQNQSPAGTPYTFNLVVSAPTFSALAWNTVLALLHDVKPVRSLMTISYSTAYSATVNIFCNLSAFTYQRFSNFE